MKNFNKQLYIFIICACAMPALVYGAAEAGSGYKVKAPTLKPTTVHVQPHSVQVRTKDGKVVNFSINQTHTFNDLKRVTRVLLQQNLKAQETPSEFEACAVQSQQNQKFFNALPLRKEFTAHYSWIENPIASADKQVVEANKKESAAKAESEWKALVDSIVLDDFTSCFASVLAKKREPRINNKADAEGVDLAEEEAVRAIADDSTSEEKFFNAYLALTGAQKKDVHKFMIERWDIVKKQYIKRIKKAAQKKKAELNSKCCCQ